MTARRDSGNVFFYIFLAVSLLGALTYAIIQGGRSSMSSLSEDRQKLLATEILDYSDTVKKAVMTLRLRGVPFTSLRFADAALNPTYGVPGAAPANEIFNIAGGGVVYKSPSIAVLDTAAPWIFAANNQVTGVGLTEDVAATADLLMILRPVKEVICRRINVLLGIGEFDDSIPVDGGINSTKPFDGTDDFDNTLGDEGLSVKLSGRMAGCYEDTAGNDYVFYQVLLPR